MKRKPTDRLMAALELRQSQAVREIGPGRFIVRSASKANKTYGVGVKDGIGFCGCPDSEIRKQICKHQLSSIYYPALCFMLQCRWSQSIEELNDVVEVYKASLFSLPINVKEFARVEYATVKKRLSVNLAEAA